MNISIQTLKSGLTDVVLVDQELCYQKDLLVNTDLLDLTDVKVEGEITSSYDDYDLNLKVKGMMVLPCALTLKPVSYPFSFLIQGNYQELMEELGEITKKNENTLDIFPIIWENILMEIPMRVVSEDADPIKEGNGWKLVTEDEKVRNSQFDKLNELLERKEV